MTTDSLAGELRYAADTPFCAVCNRPRPAYCGHDYEQECDHLKGMLRRAADALQKYEELRKLVLEESDRPDNHWERIEAMARSLGGSDGV